MASDKPRRRLQKDPHPKHGLFSASTAAYISVVEAASLWCFVTAAPANIKTAVFIKESLPREAGEAGGEPEQRTGSRAEGGGG